MAAAAAGGAIRNRCLVAAKRAHAASVSGCTTVVHDGARMALSVAELSLTEHSDWRHRERRRIGRPAGGGGPRAAKGTAPNLSTVCASDTNSIMAASPL